MLKTTPWGAVYEDFCLQKVRNYFFRSAASVVVLLLAQLAELAQLIGLIELGRKSRSHVIYLLVMILLG